MFHIFQIDKQQFEETVQTLNNLYAEAEKLGSQSYIEGCLACLTAYIIFLCMETHYEKVRGTLCLYPALSMRVDTKKKVKALIPAVLPCQIAMVVQLLPPLVISRCGPGPFQGQG